jgi:outer membrane protein assembly factor BamD
MKLKFLFVILLVVNLVSCSDYQKIIQSTDYNLKWEKAVAYYDKAQYTKAITLLEELIPIHKGTDLAEKTLYMLGNSYLNKKDYYTSSEHFETYYKTYPKGTYTEECRFLAGKAAFLNSPDPKLTQEETNKAIDMLNVFLDYYPESKYHDEATSMIVDLRDKLVYKQLLACRLYFNLGNYLGNNYESCIVTANAALLDYPVSKYREDLAFLVLNSKYTLAAHSVDALKIDRYRAALDEYYSFSNEYPTSKFKKDAESILRDCKKVIKD